MKLSAKIHKTFDEGKVKAIASLTIDDAFAVHGIKVLEGNNGDQIVMPSTKYKDEYHDTFHPISKDARAKVNDTVLSAYEMHLAQNQSAKESATFSQAI